MFPILAMFSLEDAQFKDQNQEEVARIDKACKNQNISFFIIVAVVFYKKN